MTAGIECVDLTKAYGDNLVLDGLDLLVNSGEFVALSSPSGGGKTTLLNILGGLTVADSGRVRVAGRDLAGMNEDERAVLRRNNVGIVHQASYLFPWLSVDENLAMAPIRPGLEEWSESLLHRLGINAFRGTSINKLSGGQRRRVCVLRALRVGADVLLLDEPTTGLDESLAEEVRRALREAATGGTAVLVATHDSDMVSYADRTATLSGRKVQV